MKTVLVDCLISILFLISLATCKKEAQLEKVNIQTISIGVRSDSIYLNGNIIISSNTIIDSLGFVISPKKRPDIHSFVVFSDKHDNKGNFKIILADKFIKDSVYYVRSVIQSEGYVYYGNEMSFISKNLNLPKIDDFAPTYGIDNEYVKIYGSNFSNDVKDVSVWFGTKPAEIVSCTLDRILVKVPAYTNSERCNISIKIKTNQVISSKTFFLFGPEITNFSPLQGHGKVSITINGNNFSEISWRNTVYIGSKLAEIIEASKIKIVVKTDLNNYLPLSYLISVIVKDKIAVSDSSLKVTSPWKQLKNLPISGISSAVTFKIDNKIYLCTGTTDWTSTGGYSSLFFEYDISSNQWKRKADFPGAARKEAIGFSIGNKGYIGLGVSASSIALSDFWEYNLSDDNWRRKQDFPGRTREQSFGFSYNNKGFVLMADRQDYKVPNPTEFWSFMPESDTWQKLPDLISNSLSNARIAIISDLLYVIDIHYGIWRYNLFSNEWSFLRTTDLPILSSFYGNDKFYFINGKMELFEFLPESGGLISMPKFPGTIRSGGSSGLIFNNKMYYGAGSIGGNGECINDFWSYDLN